MNFDFKKPKTFITLGLLLVVGMVLETYLGIGSKIKGMISGIVAKK